MDRVVLLPAGNAIDSTWMKVPWMPGVVDVDAWGTVPNHVHGRIGLGLEDPEDRRNPILPKVIEWFKSYSTMVNSRGVRQHGWKRYEGTLWQNRYHDHMVRDESDLSRIREYIYGNPYRWSNDVYGSDAITGREKGTVL